MIHGRYRLKSNLVSNSVGKKKKVNENIWNSWGRDACQPTELPDINLNVLKSCVEKLTQMEEQRDRMDSHLVASYLLPFACLISALIVFRFYFVEEPQLCLHLTKALWAMRDPTNTDEGNNTAVKAIHVKANLNKVSFFKALLRNHKISHKKSVWLEKSISSGDQTSCFPTTCPSVTPGLVFKKWWNNEKKILSKLTLNILKCISKLIVSFQYLIVKIG